MYKLLIGAGLAAVAATYMIAPERAPETARRQLTGRSWAHRGLHNLEAGIPENSMAAFRAALERGFGVELDLQLTADGQVVVFHDANLERMCGVDAKLEYLTYDELQTYRLAGTGERIPLFSDVLALMGGKVPLLVEIKTCRRRRQLCAAALQLMRGYPGELCVESFDPRVVAWFRRNAPDIIRGQLAMQFRRSERSGSGVGPVESFALAHVITNFLARPHFIAHRLEKKTFAVRLAERMGAMSFAWTSRTPGPEASHDCVIFEGYLPKARY